MKTPTTKILLTLILALTFVSAWAKPRPGALEATWEQRHQARMPSDRSRLDPNLAIYQGNRLTLNHPEQARFRSKALVIAVERGSRVNAVCPVSVSSNFPALARLSIPPVTFRGQSRFASITFKLPDEVYEQRSPVRATFTLEAITPLCRVFKQGAQTNANEIGNARQEIRVPQSRNQRVKVAKQAQIRLTTNLHPGKRLNQAASYSCTLYLRLAGSPGLHLYSTTSSDPRTKADVRYPLVNVVSGKIDRSTARKIGNQNVIQVVTSKLEARGGS